MTAEQILEKHLLLMLKRTDESYESIDEMKQQPEWQAVINAMLEYGEMQSLRTHDVVKSSEQLCGLFEADTTTSSATRCKCGREKWEHPNDGTYRATLNFRYAKKEIIIDEQNCKYELRLQQMWKGQDGTQKWVWVEEVG